jgi:hypothetical protein
VSGRAWTDVAATRGSGLAERIVLGFLVLAVGVLGYIRFGVVSVRAGPSFEGFDLHNPLLDAEAGECVEVEATSRPGEIVCIQVQGTPVLRPREGPERVGTDRDLHTAAPYLVCRLRYPPTGRGCSAAAEGREELERFDLNGFGMPSSTEVSLSAIKPTWVQRGGRNYFAYEVVMDRYGAASGPWVLYVDPSAPALGLVFREHQTVRGEKSWTVFRAMEGCPD